MSKIKNTDNGYILKTRLTKAKLLKTCQLIIKMILKLLINVFMPRVIRYAA